MSTLSKNEQLREVVSLKQAIISERDHLVRMSTDRHRRTKLARNSIRRIRGLLSALEREIDMLNQVRSCSDPSTGDVYRQIDRYNLRIHELNKKTVILQAEARIEKLLLLKAQFEAMNNELPESMRIAGPDLSPDPDDDMIIS